MGKYIKAEMEVIEFENEDVITTSDPCNPHCTCDGHEAGGWTPPVY